MKIPKEHHGVIMGKQGARIKQIEQDTNTKISVPQVEDRSDLIKITGNKEDCDMAKDEIQSISDDLVSP